ncbi:MAG TPA: fumarylacetoacetate hydrolase family protein [Gallionella sp.]|nr:fumarylacetoacetate hydrolase family protein [Gallionella sp.]
MAQWIAFSHKGKPGFGQVAGDRVTIYEGEMFSAPRETGTEVALADVSLDLPCRPGKFIALWNNYHAQAAKQNLAIPAEPLYFIKTPNSYRAHEQTVPKPVGYDGRVVYEGELGIVIGKRCKNATEAEAGQAIFGYTCINDITALDLIAKDASFAQWTRAKCFDGFGVIGPVIATGLDWKSLNVRTLLNGRERQNYPCSDMIFSPESIVSAISRDMTLEPGDVIACGTSLGVLPMKPGAVVEVLVEGIGTLRSIYGEQAAI